jgi:hypothetical protein
MSLIPSFLADLFTKDVNPGDVHVSSTGGVKKPRSKAKRKGAGKDGDQFEVGSNVVKVDSALGLVLGWAIVCKIDGEDYYDLQGDHITEAAMLEAATDFMLNKRVAKEMHTGDQVGDVVFAFPMTTEIAKSFGIEATQTGLLIAMKPSEDVLAKFADGSYTGFSIGGKRIDDEEIE